MDWTKAKTILIAALIITNVFLGISLFMIKSEIDVVTSDEINETIEFLNNRNIYIYKEIPQKLTEMPVLQVEYQHISNEEIEQLIQSQNLPFYRNMTKEEAIKITKTFLTQYLLINEETKLGSIDKESDAYIITYKNYYQNILLEECYVEITVENGRILSINRWWYTPVREGENKKSTIPATTALLKFASLQENFEEEIIITNIELVYWIEDTSLSIFNMENTTSDTALPAWKITYNNGETKYINAYVNEL